MQNENDHFKKQLGGHKSDDNAGKKNDKLQKARTLDQILVPDSEAKGDWRQGATGGTGKWSLLIVTRNGIKFEGKFAIEIDKVADSAVVLDVEGRVNTNKIEFRAL